MAKLKITATDSSGQIHDRYTSPQYINGAYVGGTGGLTSQTGRQIQPQVYITGGSSTSGSIIAQKGRKTFRVTDGTRTGDCVLTNSGTLAAGQMNIQVNTFTLTNANVAAQGSATTSTYVTYTAALSTGPIPVAVGQTIFGTGITGTATITAINATAAGVANVTVGFTSQTVTSQPTTTCNVGVYASRITNKFVHNFGTATTNPIKYRYHLAMPDTTFVQVVYA